MHVRVQTWIPYTVQVYVNGREWLARQLDTAGVGYLRHDNALLRIDDMEQGVRVVRPVRSSGLAAAAQRVRPLGQPPSARHRGRPTSAATTG